MKHIKIFLASPSDTSAERNIAKQVIEEINRTIGKDEFYLDLFMWEENTFSSIGEDGQAVINQQNWKYDIFVGIMWKKFGFPTPRAESATEEEFNIAYDKYTKKEISNIMFYFNTCDISQDTDLDQFQKVQDFKKKIRDKGVLTSNFNNEKPFEKTFRTELNLYIKEFLKKDTTNNKNEIVNENSEFIPFEISQSFSLFLNDMEATFAHSNIDKVTLEDIYTIPDIQDQNKNKKNSVEKTKKLSTLIDAIDVDGIKYVFIGNELAGKTACSKYLFRNYYDQSLIPIYIKGEEILSNIKIESVLKLVQNKIQIQYEQSINITESNLDNFILIIDDFQKTAKGIDKYWVTLLKNIESKFKNVVLTGSPLMLIDKDYSDPFKNFEVYQLLEFGVLLRKELVHKWLTLNKEEKYFDKNELLRKEDEALNHIKTAIGKNFFPVYPFYILSMLQALEGNTVANPNYSIHGFYYENLINRCFSKFITTKKDINLFYNYLTYFCYYLFEKKELEISIQEFKEFHKIYCKKVDIIYSVEKIMETFDNASLLHINHRIKVKEKYVYYFFVAKYLADNINNDLNVKSIISKMSIRIFRDDYANIILFITHLSKDNFIIDELINNANKIFSKVEPAKLEDDIKGVNKLVESIPKQVLELVDVDSKREEELLNEEERERKEKEFESEKLNYNYFGLEDDINSIDFLAWLTMAFKTIDILGQIAKKHWGEMDGDLKMKLISSTYNLGLRFLGFYLQSLQDNSEEIVEHLTKIFSSKSFSDKFSLKKSIEEETKEYVFKLCFMASFGTTKRISNAVSDAELKLTFNKLLDNNPSNSYKLIDLAIKLIYSGLPMKQIKNLKEEFEKNNLCTMVLQNLIMEHSYMFEITHTERSQINSLFGTTIKDQLTIDSTSKVKRE